VARITVCLFGKLSLQCNGQVLSGFDARKIQQLLCYLLLHRDHPQPREVLAGLLWGDTSTDQSKKHLRQTLWQLQSALDRGHQLSLGTLLTVDSDWVDLHSGGDLWLDVAVFEETFTPIQDIQGRELNPASAEQLEHAVQLYHGDLLEGWYEDWCLFERERLQNMYLAMLDKLMGYCEAHKQYETGIVHGTRILFFDRAREHTHRHLMRLQYLAGNRTAALRQFERCSFALNEELGVKPAKVTLALYEQIRDDHVDDSTGVSRNSPHIPEPTAVAVPELIGRLSQVSKLLAEVQSAAQHGVQAIELLMKDSHYSNMTSTKSDAEIDIS
jgi:DNA-binding SARP family transcriptional activator